MNLWKGGADKPQIKYVYGHRINKSKEGGVAAKQQTRDTLNTSKFCFLCLFCSFVIFCFFGVWVVESAYSVSGEDCHCTSRALA